MNTPQSALSLRRYGAAHGSHAHDHFQVLLGLEGTLELEVQGRSQRIAAGDGWVIAPGERHDFEARTGSQCLVLDTGHRGWADCTGGPAQPGAALALAHYLRLALARQDSLSAHYGPLLLLDCWRTPAGIRARSQRPIDWMRLARWAQLNLHQPLSVAELARQAHLSPTQFAARCRRETGMSAMHWLRDLRMTRARELRERGMKLAEAALHCGYRSPSALAAAMRARRLG